MGVENFWGEPCPVCLKPITDRESPYAVLCARCISEALAEALARRAAQSADGPTKPETGGAR